MPDPITPTLPDPQASVDAALGALPPTPVAPAPVMNAPMGDETPLAFAAPTLNAMPTPPTTPEPTPTPSPVMPVAPEAPKLEPMPSVGSSYLPPVPPATISTPPVEDKPKKKSKLMLVIIGIFALLGVLGAGGFYVYNQQGGEKPIDVAAITEESKCNGCSRPQDGGWLVWRNGECKVTGICNSSAGNKDPVTGESDKDTTPPQEQQAENASNASACTSANGVWCDYGFCIPITSTKGCNQVAVEKGYVVNYGSKYSTTPLAGYNKKCSCFGTTYYFEKSGVCGGNSSDAVSNNDLAGLSQDTLNHGLCAITPSAPTNDGIADKINTGAHGIAVYYYCDGMTQETQNGCQTAGSPPNMNCFCGTVQVDTPGVGFSSKTMKCGCPGQQNNDNPVTHKACNVTTKVCETVTGPGADTCATDANCVTAAPVLACTGLTNTPAAPVIGQTVTFTCAGTITPTGAATLSYKFRYSLNDGADQLLTNKTNTTAELAITACGTYSVQCKVCATIAGVLKCDPTWTGAIQ